jgi:hypothetical protein
LINFNLSPLKKNKLNYLHMFCQYFGFLLASKEGGDKFKQIRIYYLLSMFSLQKKKSQAKIVNVHYK